LNVKYYEEKVFKYISNEYEWLLFWAKFRYFFVGCFKKIDVEYPTFHFRGIWDRDGLNEDDNEYTRKFGNKGTWKNGNLGGPDWGVFIPFITKVNESKPMVIVTEGDKFDDVKETVFPSDFRTIRPEDRDIKIGQKMCDRIVLIADDLTEAYRFTDFDIIANHNRVRVSIKCSN
jgi:hypothetical protein